jgi:hypothetical protein
MRTNKPLKLDRSLYTTLMILLRQFHLMLILALFFNVSGNAQCTPTGNQASYGAGSWIGYVYSDVVMANPPTNPFGATYRGYVTQSEIFDQNLGGGSISGGNLCGSYSDMMAFRFKMNKNFTAGYYTFTIGGDDGVRLSLDGGSTFAMSDWNYHSYQTTTATFYLSGSTNLVLENYDQGGESRVSFSYTACTSYSTAPTGISGTSSICSGTSTTLTATGGTSITGTTYQWGTGTTVGNNIITGQTSASITVNPTTTTTYWVRRIDPSPCNTITTGVTQAVSVTAASTDPTSITGTTTLCLGNSATLTAAGGTLASGSAYEWGTGTVGSNIISGQTAASLSITPSVTTTYWVRRTNASPCTAYTNAATVTVTVNTPGGNQTAYGSGSWIGYVYTAMDSSNPPSNAFTAIYRGYVTQTETFDQNLGSGSLSGPNLCDAYAERFSIRFKMQKNFTAGYYTFTVGGDDGYRLSLDGGSTWTINNFVDHSYATSTSAQLYLSGNTNLVLEYYEQSGDSRVSFSYVACTNFSTAPTGISGTSSLCTGTGGTTLTATGGYEAPGATYQWGTGTTVGNNIIGGATNSSYYINPTTTTTYWVRRVDGSPCNLTTSGVTQTITVASPSTNPTSITTPNTTVCSGTTITLTANGGTASSGSTYQWGTGYTAGSNIISGQTGNTCSVTPTASGGYWVRRVDVSPCNTQTSGANITITVNQPSVAPTSISSVTTSCSGTNIQLTAVGGTLGTNANYQWGTGTIGNNVIGGATGVSYYPSPTATTTYWVRIVDGTPCSTNTAGVTQTVTVSTPSTNPNIAASATTVCSGANVTLTASGGTAGSGSVYQWGSGSTVGSNIISGQSGASIVVNPTASGSYWVRRVDPAPCSTQTGGSQVYINVNQPSTAPTSVTAGSSSLCFGTGGTTLTANGGILGSSASYQWGTGTIGSNIIGGANSSTYYVNPTTTTTYWVRIVDNTPCSTNTAAVSITVTAASPSTAPTGITASATNVCSGGSVTLTATGGTAATGSTYQWGTGYTVGSNIISGTTISITVNPTTSTVYWVRRIDPAPCNTQTGGPTVSISVNAASTPPTSITGGASASCPGATYTLTATGGTAASGSTYQWGTGSVVGANVISGSGVSINVTPTVTTTYWVRRFDGPCSSYTTGVTTTITITPAGDPSVFGSNVWNVYGYSTGDITLASAVYAGYYSVNTLGVDTQNGTNSWNATASPSSSAGWNGCTVPVDNFTMTLKRSGFPCGTYTVALANWDDATQVYINGTQVWSCNDWSGANTCNGNVGSYTLNSTSTIEIRVRENAGGANVAMTLTKTNVDSTAPTGISGTATVCSGGSTTLTATGGTTGTGATYEWGTGTVGSNIISGQTASSISVSPTTTTTYWVRRVDALCSNTTGGATQSVTVSTGTTAGSLSTPTTTICRNNRPSNITLSGNVGNVIKWQYANDAAFTSGVTDIVSTNTVLTGADMGTINTTRYYRAVVQYGSCDVKYTTPVGITVPAAVTYNGTWSATPTSTSSVLITSNLTLTSNLNVCSCQVSGTATVTINPNSNLIVQTSLVVDATANIIVKDKGSIVQVDDSATDVGKVTVQRNSKAMKLYDYTYWSSPVQGWKLNELSPNTGIDKYFSFNPLINNWALILAGNEVMSPAKGYIVRSPQGWSLTNATSGIYEGTFTGVPNTGIVPVTIQKGAGTMNLIGNPYPSAIDIDLFLTDPANAAVVNGTIYLWTHNTAISSTLPGNNIYNYTADDYAKYNLTGGVTTATPAISGGIVPDGKIASGQGFFIEAKTGLSNGNYTANFKNSMRVAGTNDRFYRVNTTTAANTATTEIEKNRIWVNISNTQGAYNQVLVGYVTGATDGYDTMYDGTPMSTGNVLSMYSLIGTSGYSIQGRALPFAATDVVPLGFKTTIAGNFTIALENFDGLFQNQDVFLVDKLNNVTQNLKLGSYEFTTETGTFDGRFEIRYTDGTALSTNNPLLGATDFTVYANHKQVFVHSTKIIVAVEICDLLGRQVYSAKDLNTRDFKTSVLNLANQVLIVKAKFDNNATVSKKVILN